MNVHQTAMPKPMGLSWQGDGRLVLAGGIQILHLQNMLAAHERINHSFDACLVPRQTHTIGGLDVYSVGVDSLTI